MANTKISIKEKIGYAFGDGAANIAWRGVATFLFIFYTDVFGLDPATVGILFLVARSSDGISDVIMGAIGDRTKSKYGKFRPWILWTAIPLGVSLSLLFTSPDFNDLGKIVYAYITYILFTLVYTANNIPYGALMGVMTGDNRERTSIGSYRMIGAFGGGMLVQGILLFLVAYFGNVDPVIKITELDKEKFRVEVSASTDVANANIKTENGIANFVWENSDEKPEDTATHAKSFSITSGEVYRFIVTGEQNLKESDFSIINQKRGYSNSIYVLSVFLAIFMFVTFYTTKERVLPAENQKTNLKQDVKDLLKNKPWLVLLGIGLLFNIYNSIKMGIVVIYFTHYVNNQLLAATFLVALMVVSIIGAMLTTPMARKLGKRNLFIYALILSAGVNALFLFCSSDNIEAIFTIGVVSELFAAIFPTLFFVMLADSADYSEFKNGRRATGLVYSAGAFGTKFGGGIAGAIIGFVLAMFNYNGQDTATIEGATPGIVMLMSWIPSIVAIIAAGLLFFYPLDQKKMDEITLELEARRK